jgi:diguanylate cyclase (GGDEF)-like protein/PAS domain S-box-containing protein
LCNQTWGGENLHENVDDKYFRYAFENSLDAVLLTKPSGSIMRANKAACAMFERTEEELCQLGRTCVVDLNDPRLPDALKEREEKGKIRTELNFVRKSGEIFPCLVLSSIFFDESNESWTVIIIKDITTEKYNQKLIECMHKEMMYSINHDFLTEILNRRGFMQDLEIELLRSYREKKNIGIALIDIDCFKQVNDIYGHIEGDSILKHIVLKLKECLRPYDIIGRFGGDEFIICLPNIDLESAKIIGERLRSHVLENPYQKLDEVISLTISIGIKVTSIESADTIDMNQLVTNVDHLLYKAKQERNSVYVSE